MAKYKFGDYLPQKRVLGMAVYLASDVFPFDVKPLIEPMTHRGMLSELSSVFDPLGLVAPVLLPGRVLLQELLDENLGWAEQVPEAIAERWRTWLSSLPLLRRLHLHRCFKQGLSGEVKSAQLHVFTDASEIGYGASR